MNFRKKLIALFSVLLAITILREQGFLDLNFYDSRINGHTSGNLGSTSTTATPQLEIDKTWIMTVDNECNFKELKNVPVTVSYNSDNYGDASTCKHLKVDIVDISYGVIWTPLYKSARFRATAVCDDWVIVRRMEKNRLVHKNIRLNGTIDVTGHIVVTGFSSSRHTKELILNYVIYEIHKKTKTYLNSQ